MKHSVGEVYELPRGTTVYHGTSSEHDFEIPYGPAWVSTSRSVAEYFKTWHMEYDHENDFHNRPRILTYKTTRKLKLLATYTRDEFIQMLEEVGAEPEVEGPTEWADYFCSFTDLDGWILPYNYPDGDDILLCDPEDVLRFVKVEEG